MAEVIAAEIVHQCLSEPLCGVCFPSLVSGSLSLSLSLSLSFSLSLSLTLTHTHTHTHTHMTPGQLPSEGHSCFEMNVFVFLLREDMLDMGVGCLCCQDPTG